MACSKAEMNGWGCGGQEWADTLSAAEPKAPPGVQLTDCLEALKAPLVSC